jgi:hypothetical protein
MTCRDFVLMIGITASLAVAGNATSISRPERLDHTKASSMCNLYSITNIQEAIRALFRVVNRYVGNLPPMPGVFPHQK